MSDQPTLPGMDRRPDVRPDAEKKRRPEREPPEETARRTRPPYDDTRRGYAGAPHAGTQPSYDTAKAIAPAAATMRKKIYDYIHAQAGHGATPDEVRDALGMLITTVGPRFIELRERRKIFKVDETRPTQTGKPARVHVADEYVDTSDLEELER